MDISAVTHTTWATLKRRDTAHTAKTGPSRECLCGHGLTNRQSRDSSGPGAPRPGARTIGGPHTGDVSPTPTDGSDPRRDDGRSGRAAAPRARPAAALTRRLRRATALVGGAERWAETGGAVRAPTSPTSCPRRSPPRRVGAYAWEAGPGFCGANPPGPGADRRPPTADYRACRLDGGDGRSARDVELVPAGVHELAGFTVAPGHLKTQPVPPRLRRRRRSHHQ